MGARRHRRADRRPVRARRRADRARHPPRHPPHDPGRAGLRASRAADPRREPRRGHARPRLPGVRGGVRQPELPGDGSRRRHADRPGEAVRHRRSTPSTTRTRWAVGEPRRASCSSRCSSPTSAGRAPAGGSSRCARTSGPPRRSASRCSASSSTRSRSSSGLAAVAGILVGFRGQVITYTDFNIFASINSVGHAVIGGLGYVLGAVFGAPNAIGGFGTRIIEDGLGLKDQWDLIIGSVDPLRDPHRPPERHRRRRHARPRACGRSSAWSRARRERAPLPPADVEPVAAGATLSIAGPHRPLRLGGRGRRRVAGRAPGRGRRAHRAERRGQDDAHRRGHRLRARQRRGRSRSTISRIDEMNADASGPASGCAARSSRSSCSRTSASRRTSAPAATCAPRGCRG